MGQSLSFHDLNFHHLRYFHAVAHGSGLAAVAAEMHVSQSALSVQIRQLEMQLGHDLFERRGRRLVLTDVGRLVLDHADRLFATAEELLSALGGTGEIRTLRIGALSTLSRNFQLELIRPLLNRPELHFVLRSAGLRELLDLLERHQLDLVLSARAIAVDQEESFVCHLIQEQPVSLIGAPTAERKGSRKRRKKLKFPDDIVGMPLILPSFESALRQQFDQIMIASGIKPIIRAEVDDMALLRLVTSNSPDCLAVVSPVVVRDELDQNILVEHCRIEGLHQRFFAITRTRSLPHPDLPTVLPGIDPGKLSKR